MSKFRQHNTDSFKRCCPFFSKEGENMELGVALPTSGPYASAESIVRVAQEAERLGYNSLWTYERLLYPIEGVRMPDGSIQRLPEYYKSTYEPLETLSYVAAS